MKYTIHGFSQEKLIEAELDNDDALILSVIKDMYSSKNMQFQIIDGERFIWIDQGYLLEQIPIIGSPRKLRTKIKSYCDNGFLERRLIFNKDGVKGKFSYVNVTIRLDELVNSNISNTLGKNCLRLGNNSLRVRQNLPNKDSSIKDSINISKDILSSTSIFRGTNIKDIDFKTCNIDDIDLNMENLKGGIFTTYQALELSKFLGIIIK